MMEKDLLDRLEFLARIALDKEVGEIPIIQLSRDELKFIKKGAKEVAKSEKRGEPVASILEIWFPLGKIAHKFQLYKEAAVFYRTVIEHNPSLSDAWYYLGLMMSAKGLNEIAQKMFHSALKHAPPDWNKKDRAEILVEKTQIESKKIVKTGNCTICGTCYGELGFICRYCGRVYCTAHRLPEKHHCTGSYRVTILHEKKIPTDPLIVIKELHRIGNAAAEKIWINVSSSDVLESDFDILKSAFRILITNKFDKIHQAHDFNLWFRTGKVAHCFKLMVIAEEFYRKALEYNTNPEICENLSLVLKAQRKWVEAESWIRKLIALNPEFTNAWMNLAKVLDSQNRRDEAKLAFQTAFRQDPRKIQELLGDPHWSYVIPKNPKDIYS